MEIFFIYIAHCSDGTFYTGYTTDLAERERKHNEGKGAKYTANRRPIKIVYNEVFSDKSEAMRREYEIKQMSRKDKEVLVRGVLKH